MIMVLNYLQVRCSFLSFLILETLWGWGEGNISFSDVYFEVLSDALWTPYISIEKSECDSCTTWYYLNSYLNAAWNVLSDNMTITPSL